jgi:hypothetical protein
MDPERPPDPVNLTLADLPPELATNSLQTLACPVIPIISDGQQLGSGVLVEVDGVAGILTAEHVVFDERFQNARGLWTIPHTYSEGSLNEPTTHFSSTNVRMDLLRWYPEFSQGAMDNSEWGPDLAFIRLSPGTNFEQTLRAVRINFCFLDRDPETRMLQALDENKSLLAIVGTPGEMSRDVSPTPHDRRGIVACPVFLAPEFDYRLAENGHDFFTIPVENGGPELQIRESFAGVSGGAVWRLVNLFKQDPSVRELGASDYVLAGIAFWQDPQDFPPKFIRGHGPRSLYEKFLPELRAWLRGLSATQDPM